MADEQQDAPAARLPSESRGACEQQLS